MVIHPGKYGIWYKLQILAVSLSKQGLTMNSAPAMIANRAVTASSTVPAPITIVGSFL